MKKLDSTIINAGRLVLKSKAIRKSHDFIRKSCGWKNIKDMSKTECLKIIHQISKTRRPQCLTLLFDFPNRSCKPITIKRIVKTKHDDNVFLFKALPYYNSLKQEIKALSTKSFKNKIKRLI